MSNNRSIEENSRIVRELFDKHRIIERLGKMLNQVDRFPNEIPEKLRLQIECLHEEMDNTRKHASNKR